MGKIRSFVALAVVAGALAVAPTAGHAVTCGFQTPGTQASVAGAVGTDGPATSVSAFWKVPSVSGTGVARTMVGLDTFGNRATVAAGVRQVSGCAALYLEVDLPGASQRFFSGPAIAPGSKVTVSLTHNKNAIKAVFGGAKSWTVSTTTSASPFGSAAVGVATEQGTSGIAPLANFGTVQFGGAQYWTQSKNHWRLGKKSMKVSIASSGHVLATAGAFDSTGLSFPVTWKAAS